MSVSVSLPYQITLKVILMISSFTVAIVIAVVWTLSESERFLKHYLYSILMLMLSLLVWMALYLSLPIPLTTSVITVLSFLSFNIINMELIH